MDLHLRRTAVNSCVIAMIGVDGLRLPGVKHWWHNDKMVGPNYHEPIAPLADEYAGLHVAED